MDPLADSPERRVRYEEAAARLADHDERFLSVFAHGSLEVELYAPRGKDLQTPHSRDELYVVVKGTGTYVHGGRRDPCGPHDVLFAPAGLEHRFEGFSEDFAVWVMFYGPEGGEEAGHRDSSAPEAVDVGALERPEVG